MADTNKPAIILDAHTRLVKDIVAPDCTDLEFQLLCHIADKYQLDPLCGEIRAMKRRKYNKERQQYEQQPAIIDISRDGYLSIAHRSEVLNGLASGIRDEKIGIAWAKVWRKDMQFPFYFEAYFDDFMDQYNPKWWNKEKNCRAGSWRIMLIKCAEHNCLKRAFSIHGVSSPDAEEAFSETVVEYEHDDAIPSPEANRGQIEAPRTPAEVDGAAGDGTNVPLKLEKYIEPVRKWLVPIESQRKVIGIVNAWIVQEGRHIANIRLERYGIRIANLNEIADGDANDMIERAGLPNSGTGTGTPAGAAETKTDGNTPPSPSGEPAPAGGPAAEPAKPRKENPRAKASKEATAAKAADAETNPIIVVDYLDRKWACELPTRKMFLDAVNDAIKSAGRTATNIALKPYGVTLDDMEKLTETQVRDITAKIRKNIPAPPAVASTHQGSVNEVLTRLDAYADVVDKSAGKTERGFIKAKLVRGLAELASEGEDSDDLAFLNDLPDEKLFELGKLVDKATVELATRQAAEKHKK